MKLKLKDYKALKTKKYLKTNNIMRVSKRQKLLLRILKKMRRYTKNKKN